MTLTTPALLFPAISLLLLAYTNRFLTLATLIRGLRARYVEAPSPHLLGQIKNLKRRVVLIRNMQALGSLGLLFAVVCMFALFAGQELVGRVIFGVSMLLLIASLALSVWEIQISVDALTLELGDLADLAKEPQKERHD